MEQFYYGVGIISLIAGFLMATAIALGLDGLTRLESEGTKSGSRIRFFSIHSTAAFLLGLGWGGVVCLKIDLHPIVVILLSIGLGIVLMVLMYLLLASLFGLDSISRLDLSVAVGSIAEVYITIPAKRSGSGKVRVRVNDEMLTIDAETNSPSAFKPGDHVRVIERIARSRFLVREK